MKSIKINNTSKFAVHDLSSGLSFFRHFIFLILILLSLLFFLIFQSLVNQNVPPPPPPSSSSSTSLSTSQSVDASNATKRVQARATKESGSRMENTGHIGGSFSITENPQFLAEREEIFQRLWNENLASINSLPDQEISITLPDGSIKPGIAFKTTPYDIALSISKGLADSIIISKVTYTRRLENDTIIACDQDEDQAPSSSTSSSPDQSELWDITRPLVGDCLLKLLKFEDSEGKTVFWHSSAHVLGSALETTLGVHLTIGPALQVHLFFFIITFSTSYSYPYSYFSSSLLLIKF